MFDSNTPAMDIYSAGILFFELLAGELPFVAKTEMEYRDKHLYDPLPDILSFRPDTPIKLVQIIGKMTNKRAQNRYQNGKELLDALQGIGEPQGSVQNNVLQKANQKINQIRQEALAKEKAEAAQKSSTNLLNYSINSLFEQFKKAVDELNDSLEEQKLIFKRNQNHLTISFHNVALSFKFFREDGIESYIQARAEQNRTRQREMYNGMLFESPPKLQIEKDGVKLVGVMTSSTVGLLGNHFGANFVLLKQDETDLYGAWYCCWFNDSVLRNGPVFNHYPLDGVDFFNEYEFGRGHVMHVRNMEFHYVNEELINDLLGFLFE